MSARCKESSWCAVQEGLNLDLSVMRHLKRYAIPQGVSNQKLEGWKLECVVLERGVAQSAPASGILVHQSGHTLLDTLHRVLSRHFML